MPSFNIHGHPARRYTRLDLSRMTQGQRRDEMRRIIREEMAPFTRGMFGDLFPETDDPGEIRTQNERLRLLGVWMLDVRDRLDRDRRYDWWANRPAWLISGIPNTSRLYAPMREHMEHNLDWLGHARYYVGRDDVRNPFHSRVIGGATNRDNPRAFAFFQSIGDMRGLPLDESLKVFLSQLFRCSMKFSFSDESIRRISSKVYETILEETTKPIDNIIERI